MRIGRNWYSVILLLVSISMTVMGQLPSMAGLRSTKGVDRLTMMYYNVENLFHPTDDPSPSDDAFTPEGERYWTFYRYRLKLNQLSKIILSSNGWDPPHLIILSEVENRLVLEDLVGHPLLMHVPYEILHRDSHDHRGMDVAILYRKDRLECLDTCWLKVKNAKGEMQPTREMVVGIFRIGGYPIITTGVHWTSNYGGALESESKRMDQARTLVAGLDSLKAAWPGALIIAGGDFNAPSGSPSVRYLEEGHLKEVIPVCKYATYKYQGRWESIDHVYVRGQVLTAARILESEFLLEPDEKYTGLKPFRTYLGYKYHGGISDHLPLLLDLALPAIPVD